MDPDGHSFISAIVSGIKKGVNVSLKFILKVEHFGAIVDTMLTVLPGIAGFRTAIKAARAANALKAGGKAVLNRSRKIILEFMEDELLPQIEKYATKKITSAIKGIIPLIINGIFAVTSESWGTLIAKLIDKYDNDRNNGYVFYKN